MTDFLDTLLTKEHRVRPEEIRRLDARELADLVDVARGRRDQPHRIRALGVLTALQGEQALPILSEVLLDRAQDVSIRAAAAAQLGRTSASATGALLEVVTGEEDLTVLTAALGSLARVGGLEAADAVAALAGRAPDCAAQATFTATVVAFRYRVPGHEPSPDLYAETTPAPVPDGSALRGYRLRSDETAAALTDLRADGYGVSLGVDGVLGVRCQGDRMVVALDQAVATADERLGEHLARGPLLAGVVGLQSPVDPGYAVRWLLLTWNEQGQQRVALHRPAGPPALYGTATPGPDGMTFTLGTVAAPGTTPAVVTGTLTPRGLSIEGSSAETRLQPRRPTALG